MGERRRRFVRCLPEHRIEAALAALAFTNAASRIASAGIGLDTSSAYSSTRMFLYDSAGAISAGCNLTYRPGPLIGFHYLQAVECADSGANVQFYGGGGADFVLEAGLDL